MNYIQPPIQSGNTTRFNRQQSDGCINRVFKAIVGILAFQAAPVAALSLTQATSQEVSSRALLHAGDTRSYDNNASSYPVAITHNSSNHQPVPDAMNVTQEVDQQQNTSVINETHSNRTGNASDGHTGPKFSDTLHGKSSYSEWKVAAIVGGVLGVGILGGCTLSLFPRINSRLGQQYDSRHAARQAGLSNVLPDNFHWIAPGYKRSFVPDHCIGHLQGAYHFPMVIYGRQFESQVASELNNWVNNLSDEDKHDLMCAIAMYSIGQATQSPSISIENTIRQFQNYTCRATNFSPILAEAKSAAHGVSLEGIRSIKEHLEEHLISDLHYLILRYMNPLNFTLSNHGSSESAPLVTIHLS